jgi:hypothetical protein
MRLKIWPYKMGSESARLLARALRVSRVYSDRHYQPRRSHIVLNWGNSANPLWYTSRIINRPECVRAAANKLQTFLAFQRTNVPHPDWTTEKWVAEMFIEEGAKVYCRQTLTGRSGSGIVVSEAVDALVCAPLYTKAVTVKEEYRVHIFNGEVIDYARKKKLSSASREERGIAVNPYIRNHSNGWVFGRDGVVLPDGMGSNAARAVDALDLDFGAVDICEDINGKQYVFEVNSAPGISGTTLERYVTAFRQASILDF